MKQKENTSLEYKDVILYVDVACLTDATAAQENVHLSLFVRSLVELLRNNSVESFRQLRTHPMLISPM